MRENKDMLLPEGVEYTESRCPFCSSHLVVAGRWLWQCANCGKGALTHNPEA